MGAAISWRALLLAALTSALIAMVVVLAPSGRQVAAPAPARSVGHTQALAHSAAASLPLAAQAQISGVQAAARPAFRARRSGDGFQTTNRARGLTASFDRSGVAIAAGSASLGVSLQAIGSGDVSLPVGESAPSARGNRVEYARGQLNEWYRNGPMGIEQGFEIPHSPAGAQSAALTLTMSLSGNAQPTLARDAHSVVLRHGSTSLSYGALVATDATGRQLHSWLDLSAGKLLLHVDAAGARYPLTIDPLIQKGGKLTGGEAEARFGASAALSADGDTLLVGAPQANASRGAVWVFVRSGAQWTQQGGALTAPAVSSEPSSEECAEESIEETGECSFGSSVAVSADGNTALIGDPSPTTTAGTAWVFTRSGSEWTRGPALSGEGEGNEGRFGRSVALSADGSLALVGAPSAMSGRGGAWVFTRSGSTWTSQAALLDAEASVMAHFGRSVALSGDGSAALIGGPGDSHFQGAAWTFTRSGPAWTQGGKLTGGGESSEGAHFGKAVALSGDGSTALVGTQDDAEERGAVWTFSRSGSTYAQLGAKLSGPELTEGRFGASVALSDDGSQALIGAPSTRSGSGSAMRFRRSGATWTQPASLGGTGAIGRGWLGSSVALSGDGEVAAVGALRDNKKAGAAWVFSNESAFGPPTITDVTPGRGTTEGGTQVTIKGSNFPSEEGEQAPKVMFGSTEAANVEVNNSAEISAVTPAESAGVVAVKVQTASGLAESQSVTFRFESPSKGHSEKETDPSKKGTLDPPQQSTNGSSTTTGATGGVLGAAEAAGVACRVSLRSKHVVVALRSGAAIRLLRTGAGQCRGTVTLRYKQKLKGKRFKLKGIGSAQFSIAPGRSQVVKIKLNKLGRKLFLAGHGKLNVSLAVLRTSPVPKLGKTASVRLSVKKTRKPTSVKH